MKYRKNLTSHVVKGKDYVAGKARLAAAMLLVFVSSLFAEASSQPLLPPMNLGNTTITGLFSAIEKESSYVFLIADDAKQELSKTVTVKSEQAAINNVLDKALASTSLSYAITGNQITVYKTDRNVVQQQQPQTVTGTVRDENNKPVAGVSVQLKSNKSIGTVSGPDGKYTLPGIPAGSVLVFSSVGMKQQEITVRSGVNVYDVKIAAAKTELDEVVISTGIFVRDQVTYTGSIATYKGEEVRNISTRSVLDALSVLDPSFVMIDNLADGSNPNSMKNIEVRGQTAASFNAVTDEFSSDPNMPLFILDGVEVPYSRIHDLDPYRIESINIAKDAGATAIYGSKGANGVIIIETIKPVAGEFKINYNGNFSVDSPDLSVFNMMNSTEKLEFERRSGKFGFGSYGSVEAATTAIELNKLYNHLLDEIKNGVNTYWLSEPVQNAFSHSHSIRVSGGADALSLTVGANVGKTQGVMKNNGRDRWGADLSLRYRTGSIIVSNDLDVNGYNSTESNYGAFSDWVNASPYYRKYNIEGGVDKWLATKDGLGSTSGLGSSSQSPITKNVPNPLWNAGLRSYDKSSNFYINNNLQIQYEINSYMRASAQFSIRHTTTQRTAFTDPDHTKFAEVDTYKKGTYSNRESETNRYEGQIKYNYGQTFNDMHTVGVNAYLQFSETNNSSLTTEAEGFRRGSDGSPRLAHSYKTESRPGNSLAETRAIGALIALNYSYDRRYSADFTFRTDGATTFGSNKLFTPFWSLGLGWNMHYEKFAQNWNAIERLKITATVGTTGNQNIGQVASSTVYQYFIESNIFGMGSYIDQLGAPDLPWAKSRDFNLKVDLRAWKGRFTFVGEAYQKKTNPLIIAVDQIPSTGVSSYPMHMGYTSGYGFEANVGFSPIYNLEDRIIWTIRVNGSYKKFEFGGFSSIMEALNTTMRKSNTLQQYKDGYSPTAIWAVKSAGIDPATGQEVYIKPNGEKTFVYSSDDWTCIGDTKPSLEGNIYTSFRYKNFSANLSMNYAIGGDIYNSALYDKVENIRASSLDQNQDKRALYDRWNTIGQKAYFRGITILQPTQSSNPKSSRFVQKNNYLRGVSLGVDYELFRKPWLMQNLGIERMLIGFNSNELFRFETAKYERGYTFPFARMYTLKVNIGF